MTGLFRAWGTTPTGKDPEIDRLERQAEETRQKIVELKEKGRLRRQHRLEALDALETRRITLIEIFKRMDSELSAKDVNDYADILAEVFGERKIFAHRAIGLEALLCQFMHQMLAKQHQLKILKKTGKDLQKRYQQFRAQYKEEFHSYEALSVHLETMRLSLEAQYDDIFASQHALLAQLHHVEAGGTMTNYKIVKGHGAKSIPKSILTISPKHADTPPKKTETSRSHTDNFDSEDEDAALMQDILLTTIANEGTNANATSSGFLDALDPVSKKTPSSALAENSAEPQLKSARERRREIEQKRLAKGRGGASSGASIDEMDKDKARERMRELEANRAGAARGDGDQGELRVRRPLRNFRKKATTSPTTETSHGIMSGGSNHSVNADTIDSEREGRRQRRERRKTKAAAWASATSAAS